MYACEYMCVKGMYVYMYVYYSKNYLYVYACVCVCVCVRKATRFFKWTAKVHLERKNYKSKCNNISIYKSSLFRLHLMFYRSTILFYVATSQAYFWPRAKLCKAKYMTITAWYFTTKFRTALRKKMCMRMHVRVYVCVCLRVAGGEAESTDKH